MRKHRNKQLDKNTSVGKGYIGEMIVAKVLKLKNCNIELDCFNTSFDLYDDVTYKKIQVRSKSLKNGEWNIGHVGNNFDTLFILCMDKDFKNIERVYIISKKDIGNKLSINIIKNPSRTVWYKDFQVDGGPYNDAYHKMRLEDCTVLKS